MLGGILGYLGFGTYSSLKEELKKVEKAAVESETKYKEAEETINKIKPIVDKIAKYEEDIRACCIN